ncbi:MAG: LON peptidase substrate-binding domain-containing protein [Acidimicrobiia bacterium]
MGYTIPMFPLSNVVFPYMLLPLHIFEDRYRSMMSDLQEMEEPEFGVVLIERGWEVGGGEERADLGTAVQLLDAEEIEGGRWVAVAAGTRRIRVTSWLPDAPYPMANVEDVKDLEVGGDGDELREVAYQAVRKVAALQAELGEPGAPLDFELATDPVIASYQACALSPIGPLDAQQLLVMDDPSGRLWELTEMLRDQIDCLEMQLAHG